MNRIAITVVSIAVACSIGIPITMVRAVDQPAEPAASKSQQTEDSAPTAANTAAEQAAGGQVDFNRDIRPILSNRCFTCHGPDDEQRQADLRLDTRSGATADLGGYAAIKPGDPANSELLARVLATDETRMPPIENGVGLEPRQIDLLRRWIAEGAEYSRHWSLIPPTRPERPSTQHPDWIANEIDAFVLARLEQNGLKPNTVADKYLLLRRLSLDLTGLPPTPEQVREFIADESPDAYQRTVDRLLASDAYGERWASMWLDLARYADSAGYADDPPRTIWLYRDWVIKALNRNMPFDEFTIQQVAGDLLPDPTEDQLIATAFHRNTLTNSEGGTNDEEFRNVAIVDRVNTTMEVWMGTTIACAQCHNHKFDPITQAEFFQLFAFFNNTQDADRRDEAPLLSVETEAVKQRRSQIEQRLTQLKSQLKPNPEQLQQLFTEFKQQATRKHNWTPAEKLVPSDSQRKTFAVSWPHSGVIPTAIQLRLAAADTPPNEAVQLNSASVELFDSQATSRSGRFVRISLPGKQKMIHLAEVQVFSGTDNIARKGQASQSSTGFGGPAARAIDGNTDGKYTSNSVTHTEIQNDPWWEVDLKDNQSIDRIVVWNRTDNNLQSRLNGYVVSILDAQRNTVWQQSFEKAPESHAEIPVSGRTVVPLASVSATSDRHLTLAQLPAQLLTRLQAADQGWAPQLIAGRTESLVFDLAKLPGDQAATTAAANNRAAHSDSRIKLTLHFASAVPPQIKLTAQTTSDAQPASAVPHAIAPFVGGGLPQPVPQPLHDYLAARYQPPQKLVDQVAAAEKQLANVKPVTVPVMRERPADQRRVTKIQLRGNYRVTSDEVHAGVPSAFHQLPSDAPVNRLGLAHWLVSPENPLTARVIVNRYWEQLFGTGLVRTSEEFGNQGEPPSHPQLLDWLAVELIESGWDVQHILRLMVLSSTYRQSSDATARKLEVDPFNRLLSRGPRVRLTAEMIRDQALAVAGLLSRKMYGESVRPPRPKLGLKAAFGSSTDWETSQGADRYRRALYTLWRRSMPYPSMATFDAPSRNVCTIRRMPTNTPLQALVTLNDPVYIEAAQALARRVLREAAASRREQLEYAFRLCLIRPPRPAETARLEELFDKLYAEYDQDRELAQKLATEPLGPPADPQADLAELAALTVVGNVLLNLDETLAKR